MEQQTLESNTSSATTIDTNINRTSTNSLLQYSSPSPPLHLPASLKNQSFHQVLLALLMCEDQQRAEQEDFEASYKLEREAFQTDFKRRRETLFGEYREFQEDFSDFEEIERCRAKRRRLTTSVIGAAISSQQTVQRRLWVKSRSKDWWEKCVDGTLSDAEFVSYFRMSRATFDIICDELGSAVAKEDTMLRQAIPVRQRVAVCIWRLATGDPLRLVSKRFGLGISTCHKLVLEVCAAINEVLLPKYIRWPSQERTCSQFEQICGIPNVIGAMYTTHIPIIAPKDNVTAYFNKRHSEKNQKTSYSVTLQGVVDPRGVFTDVCIGYPGSFSDELVLENSALYKRGSQGLLRDVWLVGGHSYPPLDWLLVPYTQRNLTWTQHAFNDRAESVIKIARDAFCRLKGRWRFLQKRAEVKLQELPAILGACCVLHNICQQYGESFDTDSFYEVQDDVTLTERVPWSEQSLQQREQIAHNLLHNARPRTAFP